MFPFSILARVIEPNNEFMCKCKDTWDPDNFEWISDGNNYCNILKDKTKNVDVKGNNKCNNKNNSKLKILS